MKYPEITVQITKPCHEDWNKMSPTEKGKFCKVCTKEVVDFTAKSDEEVLRYLSNNGNICGRFHGSQLNRTLIADRKKRNHWLSYAASLLLPMILFSQGSTSSKHETTLTEQLTTPPQYKSLNIGSLKRKAQLDANMQNDSINVKGTVMDDSGMPLPEASIYIKGTNQGTIADWDGNYKIKVKKGDHLVFAYVGFRSKTVKVTQVTNYVILNVEVCDFLGEVVTTSPKDRYRSKFTKKVSKSTEKQITKREKITQNYFAFQRKKWLEKHAARKAAKQTKK